MIQPKWWSLENARRGFRCEELNIPNAPMKRVMRISMYMRVVVLLVTIRVFVSKSNGAIFWSVERTKIEYQLICGIIVINHC